MRLQLITLPKKIYKKIKYTKLLKTFYHAQDKTNTCIKCNILKEGTIAENFSSIGATLASRGRG
jgi:hypothetical protein